MKYKPNLSESIARMQRFWALQAPLDRVPCSISVPGPACPGMDGAFYNNPEGFLKFKEEVFRIEMQVPDDRIPTVFPQYGHALIGALCGAPIVAGSGTVWVEPIIDDLEQIDSLRLDFADVCGQKLAAEYDMLLDWAADKCAVARYETEGVTDTMAALRGTQRLLYDLVDAPEQIARFARIVTDSLIEFAAWNFTHVADRQDLCGGSASNWSLWHAPRSIHFAEDASVLMSAAIYREFFQAADRRLTSAFPNSLLEVHAEGNHQLANFADIAGVGLLAIENPLHMNPRGQEIIKQLRGRKAFYFGCAPSEIEPALQLLGTRGVYICTRAASSAAACELLAQIQVWTQQAARD
jgi:hypothetical protein